MAEEVKKTPKPRKPRAPKAQPAVTVPENVENIEKLEEEVKEIDPPVLSEEVTTEPEKEIVTVEEQLPEEKPEVEATEPEETSPAEPEEQPEVLETKLPEDIPTFQEFQESLEKSPVELKKLNPNLPDAKSKWIAQIPYGTHSTHILFKGSYAKAAQAAKNYNKARGLDLSIKKN